MIAGMIILCFVSYNRISSLITTAAWVDHSNEIKLELEKAYSSLREVDGELNSFLLTNDSTYYVRFLESDKNVRGIITSLRELMSDNPVQVKRHASLDSLITLRYQFITRSLNDSIRHLNRNTAAIENCNEEISRLIADMAAEEDKLNDERLQSKHKSETFTPIVILSLEIAIVIVMFIAYRYIVKELRIRTLLQEKLAQNNDQLTEANVALTKQKEFVEAVINVPVNMLAVYDKEGRFISFNKKSEQELGKKASEVLGKKFLDVWPDKASSPVYLDVQRALKGESVFNNNYTAIGPDRFFQSYTIPLFDSHGEVYSVVSVANEITSIVLAARELEKANLLLRDEKEFAERILDNSVDCICVFDTALNFIAYNQKAIELFGIKESMRGKNLLDVYPAVRNSKTHYYLETALEGTATHNLKHNSVIVDRVFESFFLPLRRNHEIYGVMLIHHDITDVVKTADTLARKNRELERSNYELEQFAYVASHDLQEPLRKIKTFANLIETNVNDTGRIQHYLTKIFGSAERMSSLIHDVLHYSRVRTLEEELIEIDLNEILQQVKTDLELVIEAKNALVNYNVLPKVKGSPFQLSQLFSNLVNNAIKFCVQRPVVDITCQVVRDAYSSSLNKNADYYRIEVRDNGIGFEQKYDEMIFDVFKRLHSQKDFTGTGIGLAICKRIVSNHQGMIRVESAPGMGSVFFVYLPVRPEQQSADKMVTSHQVSDTSA